jgi:hypothetical protein
VIDVIRLIYSDFAILYGLSYDPNVALVLMARTTQVVTEAIAVVKGWVNDIHFVLFVWKWYKCI